MRADAESRTHIAMHCWVIFLFYLDREIYDHHRYPNDRDHLQCNGGSDGTLKDKRESTAGPAGAKRLQHSPDLKYGDNK